MINSWSYKFYILQERKKWALTITKFIFMTTNIHIREHLYIWKLFTLNYATQNLPENEVELPLQSLWVVADPRMSAWLKC